MTGQWHGYPQVDLDPRGMSLPLLQIIRIVYMDDFYTKIVHSKLTPYEHEKKTKMTGKWRGSPKYAWNPPYSIFESLWVLSVNMLNRTTKIGFRFAGCTVNFWTFFF